MHHALSQTTPQPPSLTRQHLKQEAGASINHPRQPTADQERYERGRPPQNSVPPQVTARVEAAAAAAAATHTRRCAPAELSHRRTIGFTRTGDTGPPQKIPCARSLARTCCAISERVRERLGAKPDTPVPISRVRTTGARLGRSIADIRLHDNGHWTIGKGWSWLLSFGGRVDKVHVRPRTFAFCQ